MLDKEKSIDAVVVATPDHTHAIVSMAAIKQGKHVYCEKPLTRTVYEARAVAKAAREAKVATQMGNQGMAFEGNRLINEWLADGAIGPVREVHVWSDRPTHRGKMPLWWAQGIERPKDTPPVPGHAGLGSVAGAGARRGLIIPPTRRSAGAVGGISAPAASATWAFTTWPRCSRRLKLGAPESRPGQFDAGVSRDRARWRRWCITNFPARGDLPPVKLHWYDGGLLPERPAELEENRELDPEDGIIFVGDKGKMLVTGWGGEHPRLLPEAATKNTASAQDPAALDWPPQGMDRGVQDRLANALEFRLCRAR